MDLHLMDECGIKTGSAASAKVFCHPFRISHQSYIYNQLLPVDKIYRLSC